MKKNSGNITKHIEEKLNFELFEATPYDILLFNSYTPYRC